MHKAARTINFFCEYRIGASGMVNCIENIVTILNAVTDSFSGIVCFLNITPVAISPTLCSFYYGEDL